MISSTTPTPRPASRCEQCGSALSDALAPDLCPACAMALALSTRGRDGEPFADPPPAPESIGPYVVVRQIAVGGMGVVYEARQQRPLERTVAIKVVKPGADSREVVRRFA